MKDKFELNTEAYEKMSYEDKQKDLYLRQKKTLEGFLLRGAISRKQFEKSLGDLTAKMGMEEYRNL